MTNYGILLNGGGTDILTNVTDLSGTGDYTVYFDVRCDSLSGKQCIFKIGRDSAADMVFNWDGNLGIECEGGATGYVTDYTGSTPLDGTYQRITVVRSGTDVFVYIGGSSAVHVTHDPTGRAAPNGFKLGWNMYGEYLTGAFSKGAALLRGMDGTEVSNQQSQVRPLNETSIFGEWWTDAPNELQDNTVRNNDWTGSGYSIDVGSSTPWDLGPYRPGAVVGRGKVGVACIGSATESNLAVDGLLGSSLTLAAPSGSATAGALAQGSIPGITLAIVSGTGTAGALAQGSLPGITLAAVSGTGTAGALAQGSLPGVTLAALAGTAFADPIASGVLPGITFAVVSGAGIAGALAQGSLPGITLAALTGSASVEGTDVVASGSLPDMKLGAIEGTAFLVPFATGSLGDAITIVGVDGVAYVTPPPAPPVGPDGPWSPDWWVNRRRQAFGDRTSSRRDRVQQFPERRAPRRTTRH